MPHQFVRKAIQTVIIAFARPYISREFFGWGRVYSLLVGDFRRDWFWAGSKPRIIRGKFHGYAIQLDLSHWWDRGEYFVGRWHDLDMQLLMQDFIKEGDTVVDVGANRGNFAFVASRLVGDIGKVICFEPSERQLNILKSEIASTQSTTLLFILSLSVTKKKKAVKIP